MDKKTTGLAVTILEEHLGFPQKDGLLVMRHITLILLPTNNPAYRSRRITRPRLLLGLSAAGGQGVDNLCPGRSSNKNCSISGSVDGKWHVIA